VGKCGKKNDQNIMPLKVGHVFNSKEKIGAIRL
jgi:hypothetical protein